MPSNHWAGYHIVSRLLDNGYQVDGILDAKIDTGLEHFFGRNSHFQNVDQIKTQYDLVITIDCKETEDLKQNAKKIIRIQTNSNGKAISDNVCTSVIFVPYLIGEGMQIDETGLVVDGHFTPFTNKDWEEKAIYIQDFLDVFTQWIKMNDLPKLIELASINNNLTNTKVEKKQILLENRDISEVVKKIQTFNKRLP